MNSSFVLVTKNSDSNKKSNKNSNSAVAMTSNISYSTYLCCMFYARGTSNYSRRTMPTHSNRSHTFHCSLMFCSVELFFFCSFLAITTRTIIIYYFCTFCSRKYSINIASCFRHSSRAAALLSISLQVLSVLILMCDPALRVCVPECRHNRLTFRY